MPRDTGLITESHLTSHLVEYWDFVKIELPAPVGTRRWTDRPGGFTGDVDGSSQTWEEADMQVGPITQSRQEVLSVAWIKFANVDYTWTNWAYTPGLRGGIVTIYKGYWNTAVDPTVFLDAYQMYAGLIDAVELSAYCQMSLRPHHVPWNFMVPPYMGGKCINPYRDPDSCQYTGAEPPGEVTCPKTRTGCAARGNTININIFDDAPKHGDRLVVGPTIYPLASG